MQQRDTEWDITIPLSRVKPSQVGSKEVYYKIVYDMYTTQYLERLGVEPTERHRKLVARHSPLEECNIEATWDEDSAVANKLRILQPTIGPGSTSPFVAEAAQKGAGEGAAPTRELAKHAYVSALPPDVPDATTISQMISQVGGGHFDHKVVADRERERAFMAMQQHDLAASEGANMALVEELEQARKRARGEGDSRDNEPVLMQWGEEGMNELKGLKSKFILPFAAERPARGGAMGTVIVPWQSLASQAGIDIQVPHDLVSDMLDPVKMTLTEIMEEAVRYSERRLPLELLTTRDDPWLFAAVRERLASREAVRLTGLLAHLLYWTVFGHLHDPLKRLPDKTRQSLLLTIQELWSRLVEPARQKLGRRGELLARDSPAGISFVLPVFILALKRCVEWIFRKQYKVFADPDYGEDLTRQLIDQLNVLMMNIFDPDNAYASFGALDSSMEAIRLWRKLGVLQLKMGLTPAKMMLGREFRTTPMVLLLMNGDGGGPNSAKTRKMLQKSSSDTVLTAVAGLQPEKTTKGDFLAARAAPKKVAPHLNEAKRATLYRTACSRLQSSGLAQLSASPSSSTTTRPSVSKPRRKFHNDMNEYAHGPS